MGTDRTVEQPMTWVEFRNQATPSDQEVEAEISALWHEYLVDILGVPFPKAEQRIQAEIDGNLHIGLLDGLESQGWAFNGATVLDVGCGTGALASALHDKGALVLGLEPSSAWARAASRRIRQKRPSKGHVILGNGATIPLDTHSVDYVISLQVLEHVPLLLAKKIIREISRVLRPAGRVYLAFENYFSFWEPHYRVRWLPYMPKRIGSTYLSLRGRDPSFLNSHIYYNPSIVLAKTCLETGLYRPQWRVLATKLENPDLVIGTAHRTIARCLRYLPSDFRDYLVISLNERWQMWRTTVHLELLHE